MLEGGQRVITMAGVTDTLNIARGGSMKRGMSRLELFVSGKLIKPYVSSDLDERVRNPIKFRIGRTVAYGYDPDTLIDMTNAFSKKVENHALAVSLHFFNYNFCRKHQTLKMTPAMAAGITDRVWSVGDIVKLIEENEEHTLVAKRQALFPEPRRLPFSN